LVITQYNNQIANPSIYRLLDKDPEQWIGCQVVDTNDNPLGIIEDTNETGNLLIIRGRIDSKEYSVPKDTVINVDKSSDKIVLYMTRDDFIKYSKV
jgi:hypothetical protein